MNKSISIFTDSLGRPRPDIKEEERTLYNDVYAIKLRDQLSDSVHLELHTFEGIDSESGIEFFKKSIAFRAPNVIVFHLGINDCAPRIFKKGAKPIIFKSWFRRITGRLFEVVISKYRLSITKFLNRTYVTKEGFKHNIEEMIREAKVYSPDVQFFAIEIAEPPRRLQQRSYDFLKNVKEYNSVLAEIFDQNFIKFNDFISENDRLISDGIHLTKVTHQLIADSLYQNIRECVE